MPWISRTPNPLYAAPDADTVEAAVETVEEADAYGGEELPLLSEYDGEIEQQVEELAEEDEQLLDDEMPGEGDETPAEVDEALGEYGYEATQEPEPEAENDENEEDDEPQVAEHLKDSLEGSLRLKRLLSREDGSEGQPAKRPKVNGDTQRPIVQAKVKQLLVKWGATQDVSMKFVLDQLTLAELEYIRTSNYYPCQVDAKKGPAELLAKFCVQQRERKLAGGSTLDVVSTFKWRWQLDFKAEKSLRELTHKDLRYVMEKFDGSAPLEDVMVEASTEPVDEGRETLSALPDGPGVKTMSRFNRLELIDPLADCAVFGDANLTFSMNLARHRKDLGHVGRVIATTFEEIDTLKERYKEIEQSIQTLEDHHAEVYHGVDCTRIAIDPRFAGMEGALGAVYYNFPHSGAIQGFFDSHPIVNWRHENLMRLFFRALRSFVKPGGLVKVSSNSGAVGVRYSYIVGSAIENEFHHVETMPFLDWHLHRYGRSYGDRRDTYKRPDAKNNQSYDSQSAHSDMVYCFVYSPTGEALPKQQIRLPPTLRTLRACREGPFKNLAPPSRESLAKQMHERFMKEVTGTHVG